MLPSPLTCHTLPFKNTPARACGNTTASSPCFSFRKWTVISKILQIRKFYTHTLRPTPRHEGGGDTDRGCLVVVGWQAGWYEEPRTAARSRLVPQWGGLGAPTWGLSSMTALEKFHLSQGGPGLHVL